MKRISFKIIAAFLVGMVAITSCTKYDSPESVAGGLVKTDSVGLTLTRKLLWVNIDGARGSVVKQMSEAGELPNITSLLAHAKYTFDGISDNGYGVSGESYSASGEDPLTWASMLTGVNGYLHFVHDGSYMSDYQIGSTGGLSQTISFFPTIVQYLGTENSKLHVSVVTPFANLNKYLGDAYSVKTTSDDEATENELQGQLAEKDHDLTIASFKSVWDAGKQGGFSASNAQYKEALKKVDEYIGKLKSTIESRPNPDYEDWMIILSSNKGGASTDKTDAARDIFGVFYYDHYTPHEMKGSTIEAPLFASTDKLYAQVADSTAEFSIKGKSLALEFNIRMSPKSDGTYVGNNWDRIMGKGLWGAYRQRSTVSAYIDYRLYEKAITAANDNIWHSFFMAFTNNNGKITGSTSYDGNRQLAAEGTQAEKVDKNYFYIGNSLIPTPFYVSSVRIWDGDLDDPSITSLANRVGKVPTTDKNYSHLLAEWVLSPENIKNDTIIENSIPGGRYLKFDHKPTFIRIANTLPEKLANNDLMMENILIAPQIIYWLCGANAIDSRMEGINFLKSYALEEQWRDALE